MREIIDSSPTLVVSREWNTEAHADPARRGGYVWVLPGATPEIILDGLAQERDQIQAHKRCLRELEAMLLQIQLSDGDSEATKPRRAIVRVARTLVVTRSRDPMAHTDPAQRGGYLLLLPGKVPEIVLDGLAGEDEQRAAEERCLRELARHELQRPPRARIHMPSVTQQANAAAEDPAAQSRRSSGPGSQSAQSQRPRPSAGSAQSVGIGGRVAPMRLGERLVAQGLLTEQEIEGAIRQQQALGAGTAVHRLGSLLVNSGRLSTGQVARVLGEIRGVSILTNDRARMDPQVQGILPAEALIELQAAPLFLVGKSLAVAMCDPHMPEVVDAVQSLTSYTVRPFQAAQVQVHRLIQSGRRGRAADTKNRA